MDLLHDDEGRRRKFNAALPSSQHQPLDSHLLALAAGTNSHPAHELTGQEPPSLSAYLRDA